MRRILFVSLLLVLALLSSCIQGSPSGKWVRNQDDVQVFKKAVVLPDHTYYYRGNPVTPEAIIAVDNRYTLRTRAWSRVEITQKMLTDWMYWINTEFQFACPYHGGAILTPEGEKVGVWFSKKEISTVKVPEPGVLQVYSPYNPSGSLCDRIERKERR